MKKQTHEDVAQEQVSPTRRNRRRILVAAGAATAVTLAALAAGSALQTSNQRKGLITKDPNPGVSSHAPERPGSTSPASTSPSKPGASPTETSVPFGTPISYTLNSKAVGTWTMNVLPMQPTKTVKVTNGVEIVTIDPLNPPDDKNVFYRTDLPQEFAAHSTNIKANVPEFVGNKFLDIKKGDTLEVTTTTGPKYYQAEEPLTPPKREANGSDDPTYDRVIQDIGNKVVFVTCNAPDGDNVTRIDIFDPVAAPASLASSSAPAS